MSQVSALDVRFEDLQPNTKRDVLARAAQLCDASDDESMYSCVNNGCTIHRAYDIGATEIICPYITRAMAEMAALARQWVDNL